MKLILQKISKTKFLVLSITTLIIFWLLFRAIDPGQNIDVVFDRINPAFFILAAVFGMLSFWLGSLRWYWLLKIINQKISFRKTFYLVMAAWPLGLVPGKIGDFVRAYPIRQEIPPAQSLGSLLLEKVIDLLALFFLITIGLLSLKQYLWAIIFILFILLFFVSLKLIKLFKFYHHLNNLLNIFSKIKENKKLVAYSFISAVTNWLVSILMLYLLLLGFGTQINIVWLIAYFPVAILAGALPVSLGGLGTRESVLILLLSNKVPSDILLWAGLSYSFIAYFFYSFLTLPFFIRVFSGHQTLIDKEPIKDF